MIRDLLIEAAFPWWAFVPLALGVVWTAALIYEFVASLRAPRKRDTPPARREPRGHAIHTALAAGNAAHVERVDESTRRRYREGAQERRARADLYPQSIAARPLEPVGPRNHKGVDPS